jgi:RimJ/RimL family protein N-acetyltransferase
VITTAHQDILASWLCKRIGYIPSQNVKCIGNIVDGKLAGVVGFDGFNGASVMMHVAGSGNWCTRSMLFATFDYPFRALRCNMVIGLVPSGNKDALRFNQRLGFKIENELHGAHPDGSLFLMSMRREECRYTEARYGKEVRTAARA